MIEIDLLELWKYYKEKIYTLLFIVIATGLIGSIYLVFFQKPLFKSTSSIALVGNNNQSINANDVALNKTLVGPYAEFLKSENVLGQVLNNLNLDYSYSKIKNNVTTTPNIDAQIVTITVVDRKASIAQKIANEIIEVAKIEIPKNYKVSNIELLDKAKLETKPYNVKIMKQLTLFILGGFVIGCIYIFIVFYFDKTVRNVSQIENSLKLPILGTIEENINGGK